MVQAGRQPARGAFDLRAGFDPVRRDPLQCWLLGVVLKRGKREPSAGAVRARALDARANAEGPHGAPQAGRQPA
jgi:hypothetical protein